MNATHDIQLHALPPVDYQVDYQIVHATLGRLRIRIPRLAQDPTYAQRLEQRVRSLEWVTAVRMNLSVCSLIVHYETSQVSLATVEVKLIAAIQQDSQTSAMKAEWHEATERSGDQSRAPLPSQLIAAAKPPQDKMVWLTWLALYPLVMGVSLLFEPWLVVLSLPLRTLLVTGVVVPLMIYFAMPMMTEIFQEWLAT